MPEQFSNDYQTTLNGAINGSTTSLVVTSATGAPAANFRIKIDTEYLLVTAVAGTTFTVTRGIEGSTAASQLDAATVTHVLTAGGLVGAGLSTEWWDYRNAPGGSLDREFTGGNELAALTRVNSGTSKGTWSEPLAGALWTQTATLPAQELDVWAITKTMSVGDHITVAGRYPPHIDGNSGFFIGFSSGTTFGAGSQVGADVHAGVSQYRTMLNSWTNFQTRGADGTIFDTNPGAIVIGWRVKYEAANTWGLYIRIGGAPWRAVQTNLAFTLSPTHFIFGVHSISGMTHSANSGKGMRIECVRINDV